MHSTLWRGASLYILPFICAVVAAFSMMLLKRAMDGGIGITRVLFVANWMTFIIILPLWFFSEDPMPWDRMHWPVITSFVAFGGLVGHNLLHPGTVVAVERIALDESGAYALAPEYLVERVLDRCGAGTR